MRNFDRSAWKHYGRRDMRSKQAARMSEVRKTQRYYSFGDQRCALLTMKSRNTCTRATDFSSSG